MIKVKVKESLDDNDQSFSPWGQAFLKKGDNHHSSMNLNHKTWMELASVNALSALNSLKIQP
jgi:hypothetical protein